MSVTIHWRPTEDRGRHFSGGTSESLDRLKTVFGRVIHKNQAVTLRAMEVASNNAFYGEVASVVEEIGEIEFWGEY